jgi:hypothetical protein
MPPILRGHVFATGAFHLTKCPEESGHSGPEGPRYENLYTPGTGSGVGGLLAL